MESKQSISVQLNEEEVVFIGRLRARKNTQRKTLAKIFVLISVMVICGGLLVKYAPHFILTILIFFVPAWWITSRDERVEKTAGQQFLKEQKDLQEHPVQ